MSNPPSSNEKLITEVDIAEFRRFVAHYLPRFGRPLPSELWHYTTADGLMGILRSGEIFFTQTSCMNDSLEQRYLSDLVHAEIRKRMITNADPTLMPMLAAADDGLSNQDFSSSGHFVACFSEIEDDLSQWRGYGGGECGYAIGFDPASLLEALAINRAGALMLPMNYDPVLHKLMTDEIIRVGEVFFRTGSPRSADLGRWATELLYAFGNELDILACLVKHPKFASEHERRILTNLMVDETSRMEFRQKRTLLARHLPIKLTNTNARLPITRVFVGPGPAQRVSRVSVGDMLLKYGYQGVKVECSAVPYRVP